MSSNKNIQVNPANTLANGKVSFKNGNPVIRFEIGERDEYLLGHTIRLCGKFCIFADAAETVPVDGTQCRMPENLGVYSVLDTLSFSTMRTKQNLEYIKNYNRFMASYLQCSVSKEDQITYLNNQALTMPNFETQRLGVVNNTTGGAGTRNSFCLPLISGVTAGGNPIPLSSDWGIGGLEITLNLAPDSNVLFSASNATSRITNGFYELSELTLVAETVSPSPDDLIGLRGQSQNTFEFNTITSFYQTINSTNSTVNLNLGQSHVLSVFGTFVPARYLNNLEQNGQSTLYPLNLATAGTALNSSSVGKASIEQVIWTRQGERFPKQFNIDTPQRDNADDEAAPPEIARGYIEAVGSFIKGTRSQVSPSTNFVTDNAEHAQVALGKFYKMIPDGGMAAGIGVAYDTVSGQGVDFSQVPWGCQIVSKLTTDNPNSLFLFVHSRNTLVSSNGSIQIMT